MSPGTGRRQRGGHREGFGGTRRARGPSRGNRARRCRRRVAATSTCGGLYGLDQARVDSTSGYPSLSWRVTPQVSPYGLRADTRFLSCLPSRSTREPGTGSPGQTTSRSSGVGRGSTGAAGSWTSSRCQVASGRPTMRSECRPGVPSASCRYRTSRPSPETQKRSAARRSRDGRAVRIRALAPAGNVLPPGRCGPAAGMTGGTDSREQALSCPSGAGPRSAARSQRSLKASGAWGTDSTASAAPSPPVHGWSGSRRRRARRGRDAGTGQRARATTSRWQGRVPAHSRLIRAAGNGHRLDTSGLSARQSVL